MEVGTCVDGLGGENTGVITDFMPTEGVVVHPTSKTTNKPTFVTSRAVFNREGDFFSFILIPIDQDLEHKKIDGLSIYILVIKHEARIIQY